MLTAAVQIFTGLPILYLPNDTDVDGAGAAAMLELLSEPLYILAAVQLRFRLRALVDTAAIVAKSAATVALLQLTAMPAALALSRAQIAFAAVTLACYGAAYAQDVPAWLSFEASRSEADGKEMQGADSCKTTHPDFSDAATPGSAGSTVRQRKSNSREVEISKATRHADASADGSIQGGLLHGPTLWLCGSFSLQVCHIASSSCCKALCVITNHRVRMS